MQFKTLSLQGFRSFHSRSKLVFGEPGLVQVLGVNENEPELVSNGAGKSTIFEAVQWVLFGRTSTNLRAGDVASWVGKKRCEVQLELEDDKHKYLVHRAWNPNELVLTVDGNERTVDQDTLERTLGYTPDTFLYSVFHAQFIANFATLTPSRQLEIYTAALRLDVWEELSDKAAALAKPIRDAITEKEKEISRLKGSLATLLDTLELESEKELLWYRERWASVQKINVELGDLVDLADKKLAIKAPASADVAHLQEALDDEEERERFWWREVANKKNRLESVRANIKLLEKGICPTCKQAITKHSKLEWEQEKQKLHDDLKSITAKYAKASESLDARKKELRKAKEKFEAENAERIRKDEQISQLIARKVADRLHEARSRCPHDTAELSNSIEQITEQLSTKRRGLDADQARVAALEFWAKAFRDIRLSLIQESIAQFEAVANNAAHALGLDDWTIEFGVESETKSGKLHRGFTIHIRSPENNDRVPFLAWSGGEATRLSLAIGIGFADLVRDFSGLQSSLEVWDEPTTWLSGDIEALLTMLHERAHASNNTIFLIDHRTLESGCFDRTLTVTKDKNGSRIS